MIQNTTTGKDNQAQQLLAAFNKLNNEGKMNVLDYADTLLSCGKYVKRNNTKLINFSDIENLK